MARISSLDPADSEGSNRTVFQQLLNERGSIPALARTLAHRPEILRTLVAHLASVMRDGTVQARLKELIAVRVGQIHRCDPLVTAHTSLARRLGAKAEQFQAMLEFDAAAGDPRTASFPADCLGTAPIEPPEGSAQPLDTLFTAPEHAALTFAGQMAQGPGLVQEETLLALREHFQEAEIIEIASVIGLVGYLGRLTNSLALDSAL